MHSMQFTDSRVPFLRVKFSLHKLRLGKPLYGVGLSLPLHNRVRFRHLGELCSLLVDSPGVSCLLKPDHMHQL